MDNRLTAIMNKRNHSPKNRVIMKILVTGGNGFIGSQDSWLSPPVPLIVLWRSSYNLLNQEVKHENSIDDAIL